MDFQVRQKFEILIRGQILTTQSKIHNSSKPTKPKPANFSCLIENARKFSSSLVPRGPRPSRGPRPPRRGPVAPPHPSHRPTGEPRPRSMPSCSSRYPTVRTRTGLGPTSSSSPAQGPRARAAKRFGLPMTSTTIWLRTKAGGRGSSGSREPAHGTGVSI